MNRQTRQTLALAGIAQAAFLVEQLARHGMVAQDKFSTCIRSLFITRPRETVEVYGGVGKLNLGLQVLQELFQGPSSLVKSPNVMRYLLAILHLERQLSKRPDMLERIAERLEAIEKEYPEAAKGTDDEAVEQLGDLYQATISTLKFRVQVGGDYRLLQKQENAARIRAVLLAGIRSAVLWQQLGGRRWHLLFYRKRICRDVTMLLSGISS